MRCDVVMERNNFRFLSRVASSRGKDSTGLFVSTVTAQASGTYRKTKCIDDDDDDDDDNILGEDEKATDCIIARQTCHIYRSEEKGKLEGPAGGNNKQELVGGVDWSPSPLCGAM
jgi:hypothetical protein